MKSKQKNQIASINLLLSIVTIAIVYFLQYALGMQPCEMCLNERYPYFVLIILSLCFLISQQILKRNKDKIHVIILYIGLVVIVFGFFYTLMHVGIERGLIEGFTECSGSFLNINDNNDLLLALENAPLIRCDEPVILLNFISIAESNLIMMGILLFINVYLLLFVK